MLFELVTVIAIGVETAAAAGEKSLVKLPDELVCFMLSPHTAAKV